MIEDNNKAAEAEYRVWEKNNIIINRLAKSGQSTKRDKLRKNLSNSGIEL